MREMAFGVRLFYMCLKCGKAFDFHFYDIVAINVAFLCGDVSVVTYSLSLVLWYFQRFSSTEQGCAASFLCGSRRKIYHSDSLLCIMSLTFVK